MHNIVQFIAMKNLITLEEFPFSRISNANIK